MFKKNFNKIHSQWTLAMARFIAVLIFLPFMVFNVYGDDQENAPVQQACIDRSPVCKSWATYCDKLAEGTFQRQWCPLTCNRCNEKTVLSDAAPNLPAGGNPPKEVESSTSSSSTSDSSTGGSASPSTVSDNAIPVSTVSGISTFSRTNDGTTSSSVTSDSSTSSSTPSSSTTSAILSSTLSSSTTSAISSSIANDNSTSTLTSGSSTTSSTASSIFTSGSTTSATSTSVMTTNGSSSSSSTTSASSTQTSTTSATPSATSATTSTTSATTSTTSATTSTTSATTSATSATTSTTSATTSTTSATTSATSEISTPRNNTAQVNVIREVEILPTIANNTSASSSPEPLSTSAAVNIAPSSSSSSSSTSDSSFTPSSSTTIAAPAAPSSTSASEPPSSQSAVTDKPYPCSADYRLLPKLNSDITTLAVNIYKKSIEDAPKDNILFSPASIVLALGVIEIGARSLALDELHKTLIPALTLEEAGNAFAALVASLRGEGGQSHQYRLHIVNNVYVDNRFPLVKEFSQSASRCFDAKAANVDFQKKFDSTRLEINQWVLENTQFKMPNLFPPSGIDSADRLVLVNTVYLDAQWEQSFAKGRTYNRLFYPPNNAPGVEVPMMSLSGTFRYYEESDLQVLGIDYKERELTLFVFLPTNREGLAQFERTLDGKELQRYMSAAQHTKVDVTIPKFSINYRINLRDTLQALGIRLIFDVAGDVSGISRKHDLYCTNAVHQASIKAGEDGTNSAPSRGEADGGQAGKSFHADHPFIFAVVQDQFDSIMLMGRAINGKISESV